MASEYVIYGQYLVKSDIFSFGVLVLEIVNDLTNSGMRHGKNIEELLSFVSFPFLTVTSLLLSKRLERLCVPKHQCISGMISELNGELNSICNWPNSCRHGETGGRGQLQIL